MGPSLSDPTDLPLHWTFTPRQETSTVFPGKYDQLKEKKNMPQESSITGLSQEREARKA